MKRLLTLLFVLCTSAPAIFACVIYPYLPSQYCMFRICGDNMNGHFDGTFGYDKNCVEWAWLTSTSIPMRDIYEVVYKWSIAQLQSLKKGSDGGERNEFAGWLLNHKDTESIDFLILAKRNEYVRGLRCTYWYYEDEDDDVQLNEIVSELKAYKGSRLRDRYTLQLVRALFTLGEYEECVKLWKSNEKFFKPGVIKDMTVDYIAGAYEWLGNDEMRIITLYENGMGRGKVSEDTDKDKFDKMYEAYYDRPQLWYYIQAKIHTIECGEWHEIDKNSGRHVLSGDKESTISDYTYWYEKVLPIIEEGSSKEMARWYYMAAFLSDKLGKSEEARSFLRQAKKCGRNGDMEDTIHALELYFNVKDVSVYNQEFEEYLFGELKWLDRKMNECMTEKVRAWIVRYGFSEHMDRRGMYYWDDVMRKIVVGLVVPTCLKSNYQTRALQYLNMAENCILAKVGESLEECNGYANDYFLNLDSLDVKYLKRLEDRIEHPQDGLDRFLKKYSYTDRQYLDDIIGTKLIREMRFGEAVEYLSRVTDEFQEGRNVYEYFNRDPFSSARREVPDARYKLHFAQEMKSLERKMATEKDPNDRADAILKYCRGLYSFSGSRCWALADYYFGFGWATNWNEFHSDDKYEKIGEMADKMVNEALAMFTDPERGAEACFDWLMYETAVTKYPDTEASEYIHGHCDGAIYDYGHHSYWRSRYANRGYELHPEAYRNASGKAHRAAGGGETKGRDGSGENGAS